MWIRWFTEREGFNFVDTSSHQFKQNIMRESVNNVSGYPQMGTPNFSGSPAPGLYTTGPHEHTQSQQGNQHVVHAKEKELETHSSPLLFCMDLDLDAAK